MSSFSVSSLRCEYLTNPIGIDWVQPRLSWKLVGNERGLCQTAYRIEVGTAAGLSDMWDSGKVESDQSTQVLYSGSKVPSRTRVYWQVTVWNQKGENITSGVASWETGLRVEDWGAKWIQGPLSGGPRTMSPVPHFSSGVFQVQKNVESARLYVSALGAYEARLNGAKIGDHELAPGWTDFRKRVRYQTFDVTDDLRAGSNILSAAVGDGWYSGHLEWRDRGFYGDRPRFIAQLEIIYADGSSSVITTNETWSVAYGQELEADIYMGEAIDARRQPERWQKVEVFEADINLVAQNMPPMRVIDEIVPVSITEKQQWPSSRWIFDLGQNMVGRVRIKVKGTRGKTITLRTAERLESNGNFYTANYRGARSTDYFTLSGEEDVFEPTFTFHGFQYIELSGLETPPTTDTLTGIVIHSDLEETGTFECSDPLLNQLQHNIKWGWKGNSLDVPTDCPQRDERLGWTGDAQVFCRTASFLTLSAPFFEKYVQDLEDAQGDKGQIPPVAPFTDIVDSDGGPAWADAFVICPWTIYQVFGDKLILERHYDAMSKWIDHQDATSKDGIRCYDGYEGFKGFGDWLSTKADTPQELIGTAFFAYSSGLMAKIAQILGKDEDTAKFAGLREKAKSAFNRRFVTPDGLIACETQTAYILALQFDLVPSEVRVTMLQRVVDDMGRRGWHMSTGFVGTSYVPHILENGGRLDVAYKLLEQKSWPSWLYAVTQGATTIWERWDGWTEEKGFQDAGMNSFNHYAYGAVGEWLYSSVAGIEIGEPGYKKILLQPRPGGTLTYAKASLETLYGRVSSDWKIEGNTFVWVATIPPNTSASVTLPPEVQDPKLEGNSCSSKLELPSGTYQFEGVWN